MSRYIIIPLFLGLLLAAPYSSRAEEVLNPAQRTIIEQGLAEAASLLAEGKPEQALALYDNLLAAHPDNEALLLGRARAAVAAGKPELALPAYEQLMAKYPDNNELRLEAARVHWAAGNRTDAMRLGRMVLAEYEKQRFQVHGAVRAGVLFDSNANQGPASEVMDLGSWRDVRVADAEKQSSLGAYVGASLDAGYRLSVNGPWHLVGDVGLLWRGNARSELSDVNSRESQWGRVAAGLRYLDGNNLFDLRIKFEIFDYEFNTNVTALGPELKYVRAVWPWLQLISSAGLEKRNYNQSGGRNGAYGYIGEYARFFLGGQGHELLLGARYLTSSAHDNNYSYNGWEGLVRFDLKLPYDFTLSPNLTYTQEFYKGPATALEDSDREDDRLRAGLDLTYAINESWSVETGYYYTNNDSNSELYKYDQHVVNLGLAWNF